MCVCVANLELHCAIEPHPNDNTSNVSLCMQVHDSWRALVNDASERSCIVSIKEPRMSPNSLLSLLRRRWNYVGSPGTRSTERTVSPTSDIVNLKSKFCIVLALPAIRLIGTMSNSINQMFCSVVLQWNRDPCCCVFVLFTRLFMQSYWQHCHWKYSFVHHWLDVIIAFFILVFDRNRPIDYFRIPTAKVELLNWISLQTALLYICIRTATNAGVRMNRALLFVALHCTVY